MCNEDIVDFATLQLHLMHLHTVDVSQYTSMTNQKFCHQQQQ